MKLRTRITLTAGISFAACVTGAALVVHAAEESDLRRQVDVDLTTRAERIAADLLSTGNPDDALRPSFGDAVAYAQVVSVTGDTVPLAPGSPSLTVTEQTEAVAAGSQSRFFEESIVDDVHLRVLTIPLQSGTALQVARPMEELDIHLLRMSSILGAMVVSGIGLAFLLGRLVANAALAPVVRLTSTAEMVADTGDPSHRISIDGQFELERLASAFNEMLAALESSSLAQRRLVADASHELQTPLTSLKTDIEVMAQSDRLTQRQRRQVADELVEQIDEISLVISNLVDLARETPTDHQDVDLDQVVSDGVAWAHRMHPQVDFSLDVDQVETRGDPDAIRQLVRNLLDNAARWNTNGHPVEVRLTNRDLVVRDHGPGIAPDDLPHLFERFYRAEKARGSRGAGLGLAIVDKVARDHDWNVRAGNHPRGGAQFVVGISREPSNGV